MQILYSYRIYTDRLLDVFLKIQEKKIKSNKKVHRRISVREVTFLAARPHSYIIFCRFLRLLPPFRLLRFYVQKKFPPENGGGLAPPPAPILPMSTALDQN